MSVLPADTEVMYFFPIVFITGPVNNGPLTACALLAGHPVLKNTRWIGCLVYNLKITKPQTSSLRTNPKERTTMNLEGKNHGGCWNYRFWLPSWSGLWRRRDKRQRNRGEGRVGRLICLGLSIIFYRRRYARKMRNNIYRHYRACMYMAYIICIVYIYIFKYGYLFVCPLDSFPYLLFEQSQLLLFNVNYCISVYV